jgi:hypothetical protein
MASSEQNEPAKTRQPQLGQDGSEHAGEREAGEQVGLEEKGNGCTRGPPSTRRRSGCAPRPTPKKWSAPAMVNRRDKSLLAVSSDVSAYNGTVSVGYGLTNADTRSGRFGRQFVAMSRDGGRHVLPPTAVTQPYRRTRVQST